MDGAWPVQAVWRISQVSLTVSSTNLPSEEFELTANSLGAHMTVTESSPGIGQDELTMIHQTVDWVSFEEEADNPI